MQYEKLISTSDHLIEFHPVAKEIEKLAEGGFRCNPKDYLLIRDSESPDITKKRLEKFAPLNAMGAALKYLRVCQDSGNIEISSESLPGDSEIWQKFLNDVDGSGKDLKSFVIDCFEQCSKTKYCFVKIDLPYLEIPESLSLYQYENLPKNKPYLSAIAIEDILSYSASLDGIDWIKYKNLERVDSPFEKSIYNLHFLIIDDEKIEIFTYSDVIPDPSGKLEKYKIAETLPGGKKRYKNIDKSSQPSLIESFPHNRGKCPVVKMELPDILWQANQVYKSQAVVYGLYMNLLHTAANAGFVQKWGKPYLQGNDKSGGMQNIPVPKEALREIVQRYAEKMGDESILMMESFNFEELKGSSIEVQERIVDRIVNYIFNTIIYKQNILTGKTTIESGLSKEFDRESQTLSLKANGTQIINFTRVLLRHVARALGISDDSELEAIAVTGQDKFYLAPVGQSIETIERLHDLGNSIIPKSLIKESLSQLASSLVENATQSEKAQIESEIAEIIERYSSN